MTSDNKNLPALPDISDLDGLSDEAGSSLTPQLSIKHDDVCWESNGVRYNRILISPWAMHYYRVCFNGGFNDKDDRVACNSPDGLHGFGHGGRVPKGKEPDFKPRKCAELKNGRHIPVCPSARGDDWICRPSLKVFGMFADDAGEVWAPFFWRASGRAVKPAEKVMQASKMFRFQRKLQAYQVFVEATLEKVGNGCIPIFSAPKVLDSNDPGAAAILQFAPSAKEVWEADRESERELAMNIAERWEEASK